MTAAASHAQTRLEHVALSTIKAHPDNPRVDVGDVTDLAASIESVGLLEPLVIAPAHAGMTARSMGKATHVLIAGHRRLAAAKKAKLATVPVLIRDDLTTRAGQIEAMLVENLQRTDLTPVEEADAYQLILDIEGLTQKALAALVGQPATRIRDRLKLTKISATARDALQAHQVTIEQALALAEFDDNPKLQKQLVAAVAGGEFAFKVNRARQEREAEQRRTETIAALKEAGVEVAKAQPKGSRSLYEIPLPGHPHGAYALDLEEEQKLHGDCPGRAAWMEYGAVRFGCTQPKLHPKPKVEKSKDQLDREAREKAELEALTLDVDAAAAVRGDYLRRLILARPTTRTTTAAAETLRARGRALVVDLLGLNARYFYQEKFPGPRAFLEVLTGATVPAREKGVTEESYAAELAGAVQTALADVDVDGLLVAADLASNALREAHLRTAELYRRYDADADWVTALTAYGYAWTDFERSQLTWTTFEDGGTRKWSVDGPGDLITDEHIREVSHDDETDEGEVA